MHTLQKYLVLGVYVSAIFNAVTQIINTVIILEDKSHCIAFTISILVLILNGNHEAVSAILVCLEHITPLLQKKGDTFGVPILSSNQKW